VVELEPASESEPALLVPPPVDLASPALLFVSSWLEPPEPPEPFASEFPEAELPEPSPAPVAPPQAPRLDNSTAVAVALRARHLESFIILLTSCHRISKSLTVSANAFDPAANRVEEFGIGLPHIRARAFTQHDALRVSLPGEVPAACFVVASTGVLYSCDAPDHAGAIHENHVRS